MSIPEPFRVALTFDAEHADRPTDPGVTGHILDTLGAAGIRATFFIQGRWAEAEPVLARRMAAEGHLVGNHSHHHARMTSLTAGGIGRDVRAAEKAIVEATGASPRPWFRCPFGAGAASLRVLRPLAVAGYVDVSWHVDAKDWSGIPASRLEAKVVRDTLANGDGTVVLLHGWPNATAAAIAGIVGRLQAAGAEFVTVAELDAVPGHRVPEAPAPGGAAPAAVTTRP